MFTKTALCIVRRLFNVDLFDRQSQVSTDITLNMALKAGTELHDRERGIQIHQQLSSQSLENRFIQTSLIHFSSK